MTEKQPLDLDALFPELAQLSDPALRVAIEEIWQQLWRESEHARLEDVPVSTKIDYPQIKHCQAILKVALAAADALEQVHDTRFDRDTLIAAAALMDVSKLVETRPGPHGAVVASELGRLLPHALYAAHLALDRGVPLAVVHVVAAHSPNGGKAPATVEARLLDWVDQLDISGFGHEIWARKVVHFQP
jgi:hypothetical protein